jgi:ankyrin repeat protein
MRRTLLPLLAILCTCAVAVAQERVSLIDAAKNGDTSAVRALLRQGASANQTAPDGTTALHWASYRDDGDAADALIRAGAKVNAANDLGATPLWTACLNGSAAMVQRLLRAGANPNAALLAGETPLMVASRTGNPTIVEQLLEAGANVNARATRGQTPLMWAVSQKHPDVVKVLIAHGADIHAKSDAWSQMMAVPPHGLPEYNRMVPHGGDTALMFAARVGDIASAKLLLAAGARVTDADAWGVSAMVLAAHSGFTDVVEMLLDKGADANSAEAGFAALHAAIMRRDERMVSVLLTHGANPNLPLRTWTPTRRSSRDWNFDPQLVGATPFWLAARFVEPNIMRLLLKHGADPKFVHHADYTVEGRGEAFSHRREMRTTLMAAVGMGGGLAWVQPDRGQREALTLETVKMTIDLGVDVNADNGDGRTALDGAKTLKFESVVNYLVDKGAIPGKNQKEQPARPIN